MKHMALLTLFLLVAACGQHRAATPLLASFERMKPTLEQIDRHSQEVASDLQSLNRSMQADDSDSVRYRSDVLEAHARRLAALAAEATKEIRSLAERDHNRAVRTYFWMLLGVLARQSSEGMALQQLARLTWRDPLIMTAPDQERLYALAGAARRNAQQAVALSARASAWRHRYRKEFRYSVPGRMT
jgi:hypothetical protein